MTQTPGCRARIRTWTKGSKVPCATFTPLGREQARKQGGKPAFPPQARFPPAGAEGRTRTGTGVAPQQFLRLSRLPIPPLRLEAKAHRFPELSPPYTYYSQLLSDCNPRSLPLSSSTGRQEGRHGIFTWGPGGARLPLVVVNRVGPALGGPDHHE